MTYKNCKLLIEKNRYEYEDMLLKLDVFLLNNRINVTEYKELVEIMDYKKNRTVNDVLQVVN